MGDKETNISNVTIFTTNSAGHVFGRITIGSKRRDWEAWKSSDIWHARIHKGRRTINDLEATQAIRAKLFAFEGAKS